MKIRIPQAFLIDHEERDLPTPAYDTRGRHFIIDTNDAAFDELVSDAKHYANDGTDADRWIVSAAKALLKAIALATQVQS